VIIFDLVWFLSKKINQTKIIIFLKKKPKPGQTDRFWFGSVWFFREKPVQIGLARFFRFWLGFSGFGSVFSVLAQFFPVLARFGLVFFWFFVGFGLVRFFWFFVYKTETELNRLVFSKI
jgi:hypothetical protein